MIPNSEENLKALEYDYQVVKEQYQLSIKKEFEHIINEVCGKRFKKSKVAIVMIPFLPGKSGMLLEGKEEDIEFDCDDIRELFADNIHCSREMNRVLESEKLWDNIENEKLLKCELLFNEYLNREKRSHSIFKYRGQGKTFDHSEILAKIGEIINDLSKHLIFSEYIEIGPYWVFFVAEMDKSAYENYLDLTDRNETENAYGLFLNTVIDNFFSRWLESLYYGLSMSNTQFIANIQAIISAAAYDMFGARDLPEEKIISKIANLYNEGEPCKGKIAFGEKREDCLLFKEPIKITLEKSKDIRKLLEMTRDGAYLVASTMSFGGEIIGLDDNPQNYSDSYMIEFLDVNKWSLSHKGKTIVRFFQGQYRIPELAFDEKVFVEKCKKVFTKYDERIKEVVKTACRQKHGTMIIVSENALEESKEIVKTGKGTAIVHRNLIGASPEMVLGLSSIDGAIVMNPQGDCFAVGAILSNSAAETGDPSRGARYNSANNYVKTHENSIAVVVSEDGMIDIL